jgi:glycosyltransferase involved in cell wall biosynthesis
MISVVIPTLNSERALVPTLAALVVGSAEGLVREVLLVDGGSRDETSRIADAAGCEFLTGPADEGERLGQAVARTRGDWLLFLDPGAIMEEGWTREVGGFVAATANAGRGRERAAVFRLAIEGFGFASRLTEATAAARQALFGLPRPDQGLLIGKRLYRDAGGHVPGPHTRRRLLRKLGRSRIVGLRTRILLPG